MMQLNVLPIPQQQQRRRRRPEICHRSPPGASIHHHAPDVNQIISIQNAYDGNVRPPTTTLAARSQIEQRTLHKRYKQFSQHT